MDYYDLGSHSRAITTGSAEAQLWFDRGLNWTYGYNHNEAVTCFTKAAEADPECAMAYWGIAYATGPNYNLSWQLMDPKGRAMALAAAYDATQTALGLTGKVTDVERRLVEALEARYPAREPLEDMDPWNDAFADAMRDVYRDNRGDLEVVTVFAEAIMNRTPWKMWDLKTATFADGAGTEEAMAVLEDAMRDVDASWRHPGVLHVYVHLMEMSPFPERALRAGDVLRDLVPDAGHLIHMPTHIDVLCGNYRDVLVYNQKAIEADRRYAARDGIMGIYTAYRVHDYHFAIYGAMFLGQFTPALQAAEELIENAPDEVLRITTPPMADFLEGYHAMKQHVLIRFGKWEEIIAQDLPEDRELYCATTAMMLYARALAHSALGNIEEAEKERDAFQEARPKVSERRRVHNNTVVDLLEIAAEMLDGELEYRRGNFDAAFAHLRRSVELDDNLLYDEPWGWMQPARHALGALLLEQDRVAEAEAVYRADLGLDGSLSRSCQHPENVWSLHGLHECLVRRGDTVEAPIIKQRLDLAAARAEVPVKASCYCSRKAMAA